MELSAIIKRITVQAQYFHIIEMLLMNKAFDIREALGIINVRLLLFSDTVLFVSREAFRKACLGRTADGDWKGEKRADYISSIKDSFLFFCVSLSLSFLLSFSYSFFLILSLSFSFVLFLSLFLFTDIPYNQIIYTFSVHGFFILSHFIYRFI
jgi:hypothetical protein